MTRPSLRAQALPKNVFFAMDQAKATAARAGRSIIDLSIGSSDLAPPPAAMQALSRAALDQATYGYPMYQATLPFRQAAAQWMARRFGLTLGPEGILVLIGAQEGLAHLLLALTDPGDVILAPDPAYPSYFGAYALAGVRPHYLPLVAERNFLPDLAAVPAEIAAAARVLILNYPNNPTAGIADAPFFAAAVDFCRRYDVVLVHDAPYTELTFGAYRAPSVLAAPGGLDVAVELHSCSKTYHLPGLRVGWAAGNHEVLAALAAVKGPVDFNQYLGIQQAAIAALESDPARVRADAAIFERRRDCLLQAMAEVGWPAPVPSASMYVWAPLPAGHTDSFVFCQALCLATGVALAPGRAFGDAGEGAVRFALVREETALVEAVRRIAAYLRTADPA